MERLDGVAVIYRLASSIAAECGPVGLRWYRSAPLDAVITLPGGRIVGVVRQGLTSDRTGFSKRLWRLREGPLPGVVFMLMTDQVRLRHARRLLDGSPVSALLALERDAVLAGPAEPVWRLPSVAASLDLRYVLSSYVASRGVLPTEPEPLRASLPEDIDMESPVTQTSDWLLPAALRPAAKRLIDLLYDWPGIAPEHLRRAYGGLACSLLRDHGPPVRGWAGPAGRHEGPPPGPLRPGAGAPCPKRPCLRGCGQETLERRADTS